MKRGEVVHREALRFELSAAGDHDFFERSAGNGPPIEFPVADQKVRTLPVFHIRRGPVAPAVRRKPNYAPKAGATTFEDAPDATNRGLCSRPRCVL